jgi:uncharacterized membrane protein YdfJ with MMPL/SSD domain
MEKPDRLVRFADLAKALGKSKPYVTELRQAGRLVLSDDARRCWLQASLVRIAETSDPSKQGVVDRHAAARSAAQASTATADTADGPETDQSATQAADEDDLGGNTGYQESRAKRERYLALAAQRDYEQSIGKLMDAADVESAVASAATTLRTSLESLPDVLAPQLSAITDEAECRAVLAEAIEHALGEISHQFNIIAKAQAT